MVTTQCNALMESVRKGLEGLYLQCELIQAGLIVAASALKYQNADYDAEVARMLEYGIGDRLHVQLECISEMIESLQGIPPESDADPDTDETERAPLQ